MKKTIRFIVLLTLVATACERAAEGGIEVPVYDDGSAIPHGMIRLGRQLEDPYSVENMTKALQSLYPTKADVIQLHATDSYVRILPRNDEELAVLEEMGVVMLDHPLDYQILSEGDWYHDPEIPEGDITWQYAVVPVGFQAPEGIRCELLHDCYLAEAENATKAGLDWVDWNSVERESFRLTGNADMLPQQTKAESGNRPKGRITVLDPDYDSEPVGVSGVMVSCNVFVKFARTFTDEEGYYEMEKSFSSDPRYRLVFTNRKGFSIGFNMILVKGSVSTLGKHGSSGYSTCISASGDINLFRRAVINNAAFDYFESCRQNGASISLPPANLRIWQLGLFDGSATPMLQQGAVVDLDLIDQILGDYSPVVKMFLPDIVLGLKDHPDYASIYRETIHEMAHTSHYMKVGNRFWDYFVEHILTSYVTSGGITYGIGTEDYAGYCEVGEMWAYYVENILYRERYPDWLYTYGLSFWFNPQIMLYMDDRGINRFRIFGALDADVHSKESLKSRLLSLYPECKSIINEAFNRYN